jgi:hypothetical protein
MDFKIIGSLMQKYIKLQTNYLFGYKRYISREDNCDENDQFIFTLFWALEEFYYEDLLIRFLTDSDWEDQGGNEGFIQKVGNMVEIYLPQDESGLEENELPIPSAVVSIENLKVLAQDWKTLYEKSAPVIYLIVEDNDWVVLREQLEE